MAEQAPEWRRVRIAAACVVGLTFLGMQAAAQAPDDEQGRRARNIAENINSPFCKATTLASCGSGEAAAWRADIRRWVAEGVPEHEICRRLSARAGKDLCGRPSPTAGIVLPVVLSLLAIALLAILLRRFVGSPPAQRTQPPSPPADPTLDRALDQELERLDDD